MSNARNIVVLKNLPSNIIEEAFIILKKDHRAIKLDFVNNENDFGFELNEENDYIIKEAELLVNSCIESQEKKINYYKKYKRIQKVAVFLGLSLGSLLVYILI